MRQKENVTPSNSVPQQRCHGHFGSGNSVLRVAVLCVGGCMSASLASIHEMPVISSPHHPYPAMTISSVQLVSRVRLCDPMDCSTPGFLSITNPQSLLKLMSIESVMLSNHLILCCPLLLPPSIFARIRLFSNESVLRIRRPDYWSFSFSISPSLNIHWNIHDNKISLNMATCPRRSKISPFKNHGHR